VCFECLIKKEFLLNVNYFFNVILALAFLNVIPALVFLNVIPALVFLNVILALVAGIYEIPSTRPRMTVRRKDL